MRSGIVLCRRNRSLPTTFSLNSLGDAIASVFSQTQIRFTWPTWSQNFPFLRHFPHRVYSCATRVSKPNPAIYKAGLAKCGVAAKEALYIDDIPAYVEAAQGLGMDGIVFSSAEQLQIALQARGIVPTIP